jgi:nitrate/nitrite transporter NarK
MLITTYIPSIGASWQSVGGQVLASVVLLLSGYQDLGLRSRVGAAFGFFMAIAFGISALGTAIRGNLWSAVAICAVVLCFEAWLMLRWRSKGNSAGGPSIRPRP